MTDQQFSELMDSAPQNANITKYLIVTRNKLSQYRRIAVSYSGGSDSDTILDLMELVKPEDCGEIKYVFFDTGLEWDATLRHLDYVEQKYGVHIERRKAKKSIPAACREYGVPFISKSNSEMIGRLQKCSFDWSETALDTSLEKYKDAKSGLMWYFDGYDMQPGKKSRFTVARHKLLKEFMTDNPPDFNVSAKCCKYAKKNVAYEFDGEYRPDLKVIGMRQAEGGVRVGQIKNCFSIHTNSKPAEYRPLWFWTDEDKRIYKEWRGLQYSDCYELWGFKRTGCVGCPCASASASQLEQAKQYEPNKIKAAYAVFGKSYEYREKYNIFKSDRQVAGQTTFDDMQEW